VVPASSVAPRNPKPIGNTSAAASAGAPAPRARARPLVNATLQVQVDDHHDAQRKVEVAQGAHLADAIFIRNVADDEGVSVCHIAARHNGAILRFMVSGSASSSIPTHTWSNFATVPKTVKPEEAACSCFFPKHRTNALSPQPDVVRLRDLVEETMLQNGCVAATCWQRTVEWFVLREFVVTSTMAHSVLSLTPDMHNLASWLKTLGWRYKLSKSAGEAARATGAGQRNEAAVCRAVSRRLRRPFVLVGLMVRRNAPFVGTSLDFMMEVVVQGTLRLVGGEIKTTVAFERYVACAASLALIAGLLVQL
jgi:hypothetical protein